MRFKKKKLAPDQYGLGFSVEECTRMPATEWQVPEELPDRLYGNIAVDTETNDEGLGAGRGPAWPWGGGYVVGYSIAADNWRGYLPVAHLGGGNMDGLRVRRWLNAVLADETQPKIFANAMYDIGWMATECVTVKGPLIDVQLVEALLDEHRFTYSLDAIAKDRVGRGKNETVLKAAASSYELDPKKSLWRLPAKYVADYALDDAVLTQETWAVQQPLLKEQGLVELSNLEHALLPMYIDMRRRGVRIDQSYTEQLVEGLDDQLAGVLTEIHRRSGYIIDIWSANSVAKVLDSVGIPYEKTRTGMPSITADFLERTDHWLTKLLAQARRIDKLASTFLRGQILEQLRDGRIHAEIHPMRSDDGGTVTGRLSMSNPNLQFIPARTVEGKRIRGCFLPEEGEQWASLDFSQQEPRLTVHFATLLGLRGAAEAAERYSSDPSFSYHKFTEELTGLPYDTAKALNLAIIYGRGIKSTALQLGRSEDETRGLFDQHAAAMPFVAALADSCKRIAGGRGYLKSLLGRRVRFPFWEPSDWDARDGRLLLEGAARAAWPGQRLVRARIHKALNSLIQPSAADMTKAAMLAVWKSGLGRHVLIQIHDELACSIPEPGLAERIKELMVHAVELVMPLRVDIGLGANWKDAG